MKRLSIKALALACGITFGFYMFLLGLTANFGWGTEVVSLIGTVYKGYAPGFFGALIGFAYAFIDGAIGGAIFAFLYNVFSKGSTKKLIGPLDRS